MNIWEILGIEPTRDRREIKRGYAAQLRQINQETDVERFDRLQQAYNQALAIIEQPDQETAAEQVETDKESADERPEANKHGSYAGDVRKEFLQIFADPVTRSASAVWHGWLGQHWRDDLELINKLAPQLFDQLIEFYFEPDFAKLQHDVPPNILVELDTIFQWQENELRLLDLFHEQAVDAVMQQLRMASKITNARAQTPPTTQVPTNSAFSIASYQLTGSDASLSELGHDVIYTNMQKRNYIAANFWWRSLATSIDLLLVLLLILSLRPWRFFDWSGADNVSFWYWGTFGFFSSLFESMSIKATPGKLICKLHVRYISKEGVVNDRDLAMQALSIRYLSKVLSTYTLGIPFLVCLFRSDKRTLHDMWSSTEVVKRVKNS